jgi:hypothetical protein
MVSNNKLSICQDKPSSPRKPSVPSELSATITTPKSIYRIAHSDTWACNNCRQKGDKWFVQKHQCRGLGK